MPKDNDSLQPLSEHYRSYRLDFIDKTNSCVWTTKHTFLQERQLRKDGIFSDSSKPWKSGVTVTLPTKPIVCIVHLNDLNATTY